jgi:hypothetical protein
MIDGLGFGNVIYTGPLKKQHLQSMFKIEFDESYSKGTNRTYSIVSEYISDELK